MSSHQRLEREIAIQEGRAWLASTPGARLAADHVTGVWYHGGAFDPVAGRAPPGAQWGEVLVAIREPADPHGDDAIALWTAAAQVGHLPGASAALLAPLMDAGLPLWARVHHQATREHPSRLLVEVFGLAIEALRRNPHEA